METDPYLTSADVLNDEHLSNLSIKKDEHDMSESSAANESVEPRKRSHSVLHWMQKNLANVTSSHPRHEDTAPRQRAATITLRSSPQPSRRSPPISQALKKYGRPRSSTLDSVGSTGKRMPPAKKILSDTDEQAQQSPSILQFAFGR